MTIPDDACALIVQAAGCAAVWTLEDEKEDADASSRAGRIARQRKRQSVHSVYMSLGDTYFRRAYRMSYDSFRRLHKLLATGINSARLKMRRYIPKGGRKGGKFKPPPIRNGRISTSVRLACALRYFAGGSPYDLVGVYGISHTDVMDSVWHVVDAVNNCSKLAIAYPSSVEEQRKIVAGFQKASTVDFDICAGAIDGILIWTQKPTAAEAQRVGVGQKKFFCGRKHKFGLNCQAVADVNGKILDISLAYGASAADCVAFEASDLYSKLENGLLKNGYILFGDNAYLNSSYMATPYSNVSGNPNKKSEDNYNFFHSQLRIRVECAFGMLVARWGVLRTALHCRITVTRVIALVNTLARLHNYCLGMSIPAHLDADIEYMLNEHEDGYVAMDSSDDHGIAMPTALMDVGHHFDEVPRNIRRNRSSKEEITPREILHDVVLNLHAQRPKTI